MIHYYMCYSRAKTRPEKIKDPNCKNEKWRVEDLDQHIIDAILDLKYNHTKLQQLLADAHPEATVDTSAVTQKRIAEIEQQISKLLDLYQMQNIPFEQISDRISSLTLEKQRLLQTSLESQKEDTGTLNYEKAVALLDNAETILRDGTLENRRFLVHAFIKRIVLLDKTVEIEWNL